MIWMDRDPFVRLVTMSSVCNGVGSGKSKSTIKGNDASHFKVEE